MYLVCHGRRFLLFLSSVPQPEKPVRTSYDLSLSLLVILCLKGCFISIPILCISVKNVNQKFSSPSFSAFFLFLPYFFVHYYYTEKKS